MRSPADNRDQVFSANAMNIAYGIVRVSRYLTINVVGEVSRVGDYR